MPQTGQGWGQVLHQMLTTVTPATLLFLIKFVLNTYGKREKKILKRQTESKVSITFCGSPTSHHRYYFMAQCLCTRQ